MSYYDFYHNFSVYVIFYARMFDEVEKGVRERYWAVTLQGETMDVAKV